MEKSPDPSHFPPKSSKGRDFAGLYIGFQFAIVTVGGLALGYWLDQRRYLPQPLGTIGGFLLGSVLGMYYMARAFK